MRWIVSYYIHNCELFFSYEEDMCVNEPSPYSNIITLNIGGTKFVTSLETLQSPTSDYFRARFSGIHYSLFLSLFVVINIFDLKEHSRMEYIQTGAILWTGILSTSEVSFLFVYFFYLSPFPGS